MVNNEDMETQRVESLWTHLYWLTILAQQDSYTRAATRLGVSKAAMSQRIAELERAAGVSLVQRTTRSVRLTEAGQRLVEQTRGQYADIAQSFAGVRDSAGIARGAVCSPTNKSFAARNQSSAFGLTVRLRFDYTYCWRQPLMFQ